MKAGRVAFVGAGPGAADLITLRGAERLAAADVVLFDALTDPALRVHAPRAQWIDVGKRGFAGSTQQAAINALLLEHAARGCCVVRLKGGDPSIFGRLEEELLALAGAGIECEVVPGVSAALAAAAESLRPLTRRGDGRSLRWSTAVTAPLVDEDGGTAPGDRLATPAADTEVYYMAGRQLAILAERLLAAGWPADTPARVSSRAGWPDARHSDHRLADLPAAGALHAGRPTVLIVGAGARPLPATAPSAQRACSPAVSSGTPRP